MIQLGEQLPDFDFFHVGDDGPEKIAGGPFFAGKKTILIGLPGAFTPTCSEKQVPSFIVRSDSLAEKGIDQIAVVSVNDHWVMQAWQKHLDPAKSLVFLGDGNAEFARMIGLDEEMLETGYGTRMRRFVMLVDDGILRNLAVEEHRGQHQQTDADAVMEWL